MVPNYKIYTAKHPWVPHAQTSPPAKNKPQLPQCKQPSLIMRFMCDHDVRCRKPLLPTNFPQQSSARLRVARADDPLGEIARRIAAATPAGVETPG